MTRAMWDAFGEQAVSWGVIDSVASDYRVSQALTVRFMGAFLVLVGLLVFATAGVVGLFRLPVDILSVVVILAVISVVVVGFLLTRLTVLVRLDDLGYQVRYLRKAGVLRARWSEVEDVVSGFASGEPVVVIRLQDGRTTTIPVNLVAGSADEFARDIGKHAQAKRRKR